MNLEKWPIIIKINTVLPDSIKYGFYANGRGYENYLENKKQHQKTCNNDKSYEEYMSRKKDFAYKLGSKDLKPLELFNKNGVIDKRNKLQSEVKNGSYIWDVVISFSPSVSKKNDIPSKAQDIAKKYFTNFVNNNAIYNYKESNLNFVGVVHTEKNHHHMHLKIFQPSSINKEEIIKKWKPRIKFHENLINQETKNLYGYQLNFDEYKLKRKEMVLKVKNVFEYQGLKITEMQSEKNLINNLINAYKEAKKYYLKYGKISENNAIKYHSLEKPFILYKIKSNNFGEFIAKKSIKTIGVDNVQTNLKDAIDNYRDFVLKHNNELKKYYENASKDLFDSFERGSLYLKDHQVKASVWKKEFDVKISNLILKEVSKSVLSDEKRTNHSRIYTYRRSKIQKNIYDSLANQFALFDENQTKILNKDYELLE